MKRRTVLGATFAAVPLAGCLDSPLESAGSGDGTDDDVLVTQAVADTAPCPWDRRWN